MEPLSSPLTWEGCPSARKQEAGPTEAGASLTAPRAGGPGFPVTAAGRGATVIGVLLGGYQSCSDAFWLSGRGSSCLLPLLAHPASLLWGLQPALPFVLVIANPRRR